MSIIPGKCLYWQPAKLRLISDCHVELSAAQELQTTSSPRFHTQPGSLLGCFASLCQIDRDRIFLVEIITSVPNTTLMLMEVATNSLA